MTSLTPEEIEQTKAGIANFEAKAEYRERQSKLVPEAEAWCCIDYAQHSLN